LGIIQKQASKTTLISFVGMGFAAITRLAMPIVLHPAQIGLLGLLDLFSGYFVMIFNFGYNLILNKLFPKYRDDINGHSGFLILGILLSALGVLIGSAIYYLTEDYLLANQSNHDGAELIRPFAFLIPILFIFRILFLNIDGYVRMLMNTIIGTFLESFLTKILLFVVLVLFAKSVFNFEYFVYAYSFLLALPGAVIVIYAFKKTNKISLPKANIFDKKNNFNSLVLFGVISSASASIILYTDTFMLYKMIPVNPEAVIGVYLTMLFAANLINIPSRNLNKISAVLLAESWRTNDLKNIQEIYTKSCVNLLVIGVYLFVIGWACLDPVLSFMKPEYEMGKYVFFFLGLSKVIELGTGVNTMIIETSEKYRLNTYFNIVLIFLVVGLNYIFIRNYGIIGAASTSFIAVSLINIAKAIVLNRFYKLKPFTKGFWMIALIGVILITGISIIDYNLPPFFKIVINFLTLTVLFWFVIVKFNLAPDIIKQLLKVKNRAIK
jgi:O-antigen/teichoic acid export membrane protein